MLSSVISRRMLTDMIEQQLHARLHDSIAKAKHSAKALMCQEDFKNNLRTELWKKFYVSNNI